MARPSPSQTAAPASPPSAPESPPSSARHPRQTCSPQSPERRGLMRSSLQIRRHSSLLFSAPLPPPLSTLEREPMSSLTWTRMSLPPRMSDSCRPQPPSSRTPTPHTSEERQRVHSTLPASSRSSPRWLPVREAPASPPSAPESPPSSARHPRQTCSPPSPERPERTRSSLQIRRHSSLPFSAPPPPPPSTPERERTNSLTWTRMY